VLDVAQHRHAAAPDAIVALARNTLATLASTAEAAAPGRQDDI